MTWSAVWPAAAGAMTQEVLHWYLLRTRLDRPESRRLLRSPGYWVVTLAMIVASAAGTALLYGGWLPGGGAYLIGAAFPMLLKKLIAATAARPPAPAAIDGARSWWSAYLEVA